MPNTFDNKYNALEKKFEAQVERDRNQQCDDIVYLPLFPKPNRKVDYILIAMEPSLTEVWAKPPNRKGGGSAVKKGFRNFMPNNFKDTIIHYCAQKYLCGEGQTYYITDMSKGAMKVKTANTGHNERHKRWSEWFGLFQTEVELVGKKDKTVIFAMGKKVHEFLTSTGQIEVNSWLQERFPRSPQHQVHFSRQAIKKRREYIAERRPGYNTFKPPNEKDLIKFADEILSKPYIEPYYRKLCLGELEKSKLKCWESELIKYYYFRYSEFKEEMIVQKLPDLN